MKLTAVLLTLAFLQVQAHGLGQEVTLNVKEEKLEKVLSLIEKQTGYVFFTTADLIKKARPVTIQVRNEALGKVLDLCFKGQLLDYVIDGKTISVVERKAALISNPTSLNTDQIKKVNITGRVLNEKDEPVAGATVMVKGSTYATATDEKGEFRLEEIEESSTLIITGANIETNEVKIRGRENVAIKVQMKIGISEAVVVTVNTGYQNIPKERATGSFAQPDKEMFNARVSTDVISRIEGITSGVVFNRFASGNISNISVRGRSTIFANAEPLIVVDNFPYEGNINNINPNDIENITILKDAAAASIWGARSGNGVIVITTKRGKYNQPIKVDLNTNVTVGEKPDLYYDQNFLNSSAFIDMETFLFSKNFRFTDTSNTSRPPFSPLYEILFKRRKGIISPNDSISQIESLRSQDIRRYLGKYFYQNAVNQQYSVNISGGSNNTSYFFSAGFDKNRSAIVNNGNERVTINSFFTFTPAKNLELSSGVNYTQLNTESNNALSDISTGSIRTYGIYPYAQLADVNGNPLPVTKEYRQIYVDTVGSGKLLDWRYYPLKELSLLNNNSKLFDIRLTPSIKYTILKGLSVEAKYQYQKGTTQENRSYPVESFYTRNLINRFTSLIPNGQVRNNIPIGDILDFSNSSTISHGIRAQINFTKTWNKHSVTSIAGAEAREVKTSYNGNRTYGYDPLNGTYGYVNLDSTYNTLPTGSLKITDNSGLNQTIDRFRSFFINGAYTYDDKYTVSISGRIDQSNLFGAKSNQKSIPLWSTGIKWDISKEKFYNINFLPLLKIRATYGYNGNVNNTLSAYLIANYVNATGNLLAPLSYANITTPGNPELRWEKSRIFNIGVDFETSSSIISGSIEYFNKKGIDLIGDNPIASSSGVTQLKLNYANMSGQGIDVILVSKNIDKEYKWQTKFLFSYATDKITKYNIPASVSGKIVGKPVQFITSLPWFGLDSGNGDPIGILADTTTKNYGALNNLTVDHRIYNGPANPTLYGGMQNTFSWKGFSLNINISFKAGYYFKANSISYSSLFNNWSGHKDYTARWQKAGDENTTTIPSLVYPVNTARDAFYNNSEILIERGDHIRLQDISLGYTITKRRLRESPFSNIHIYAYANNLGILWRANKKDLDPDFQTGYPAPRTISLGLRMSL